MTGKIIHFNKEKAFGYIKKAEREKDVFFHISDFMCFVADTDILKGSDVEFDIIDTEKGPRAIKIDLK